MASKLYFKYGAMGSSKTANLLIAKFNYEEKGKTVLLLKPAIDNRDGEDLVKSRVGLEGKADVVAINDNICDKFKDKIKKADVVLVDEAQFMSEEQINQLHDIVLNADMPVICYGLLTDFTSHLFAGSKRLIEIAESVQEMKTICKCGRKATINAKIVNGKVTKEGDQIEIGGNEKYTSMCYTCWLKALKEQEC